MSERPAPVDRLSPQSETWARGIDLAPLTPHMLRAISDTFRSFALTAQSDDERAGYLELAEKWGQP